MAINLVNDNISTIEIQGKKYNIKAIPFHGTAAEWENNNYIPKDGEIIIYDIDENYNYKRIKIGNGTDIVSVLPFLDEDITSRILALETWSQEIEEKIAYIDIENNENVSDMTYSGDSMEFPDMGEIIIEDIVVEEEGLCKGIYNLHGQKLERLPDSGIVIVDRRKYLIK